MRERSIKVRNYNKINTLLIKNINKRFVYRRVNKNRKNKKGDREKEIIQLSIYDKKEIIK